MSWYAVRQFGESEELLNYLNGRLSRVDHKVVGTWGTPAGIYLLIEFYGEGDE